MKPCSDNKKPCLVGRVIGISLNPCRFGIFGRSHKPQAGGFEGDSIPFVKGFL
jgi:hypothetical protein